VPSLFACSRCGKLREQASSFQHEPGAKLDAEKIRADLLILGFAKALEEVGKVSTFGAKKYTENGWQAVENGTSRYTAAMLRHVLKEGQGEEIDPESGLLHAAHTAWNALARLDFIMRDVGKPDF